MITVVSTGLPGCRRIVSKRMEDARGAFVKTYHESTFRELGLNTDWREEFYSVSKRNVLRGLHFQLPPHDHFKLVYCIAGRVLDAVVDLRTGAGAYGEHILVELSEDRPEALYIPPGMAHGFYTLSEQATLCYKVSTEHAPEHDAGVAWDSAAIPWPADAPVISDRDATFPPLADYNSPF